MERREGGCEKEGGGRWGGGEQSSELSDCVCMSANV